MLEFSRVSGAFQESLLIWTCLYSWATPGSMNHMNELLHRGRGRTPQHTPLASPPWIYSFEWKMNQISLFPKALCPSWNTKTTRKMFSKNIWDIWQTARNLRPSRTEQVSRYVFIMTADQHDSTEWFMVCTWDYQTRAFVYTQEKREQYRPKY